ncbi:ABC transporter substrate-binding protein [Pseudomonas entomophila]|nr:ABC transporter substrate-binding protein [Pseudomonas entomophila]MDF0729460.1 ABC transporter substrate-binding protein [Pseudomonas entomophila]
MACTALATLAFNAQAAVELPASIKSKGEIVAAIVPNYPPMDFKDPATNQLTGVDFDLGNALAERLGVKIRWQETAFEQMISALSTKRVDIILSGMTDTAERQQVVTFVDYFTSGPQFYTLQSRGELNAMTDLCGKKVGTSRRTTWPNDIATWSKANCEANGKPAVVVLGSEGSADARAQLRQGRLDAAVQGSETLPYIQNLEPGVFKSVGTPITTQLTGLGVAKDDAALSAAIKAAMQSMVDDGTYLAILNKWGVPEGALQTITVNGQ